VLFSLKLSGKGAIIMKDVLVIREQTEVIPKAKENGNIRAMPGVSYLANFSLYL